MKRFLLATLCLAIAAPIAAAQTPAPAPAAPEARKTREVDKESRSKERILRESLQNLPAEQKAKVMKGLQKIWKDPEAAAARQKMKEANENFRVTMRKLLEQSDPEIRPLLENLMKAGLQAPIEDLAAAGKKGQNGPLRYLLILGIEKSDQLTEEERSIILAIKDKVMEHPKVKSARDTVEQATGVVKLGALRDLHRVARQVAVEAEPKIAPLLTRFPEPAVTPGPEGK